MASARRLSSTTSMPRYEPLPRSSSSSRSSSHSPSREEFKDKPLPRSRRRRASLLLRKTRRQLMRVCRPLYVSIFLFLLLVWQMLWNASYLDTVAPDFDMQLYKEERVFIAANIIDGNLIKGAWGRSLLELVEKIGKERVFVSIYGGPGRELRELEMMLECECRIVSEEEHPVDLRAVQRTVLPSGESRIKRIAFLAEVRNRVLEPLRDGSAWKAMYGKGMGDLVGLGSWRGFERVLFINDVYFSPEGATRLLWGTKIGDGSRKGAYKAVCAADFVASWKMYDTFGTRDAEGYSLGVPIFPWFSKEGDAVSRSDVLAGKDAVRVKSCWGGMVAFDGRYFQKGNWAEVDREGKTGRGKGEGVGRPEIPLMFRSEAEPFWDSSECCLIHADIISLPSLPPLESTSSSSSSASLSTGKDDQEEEDSYDTGIYLNPYVRTAYSYSTYHRIHLAKRFERLLSPLQSILNHVAHMPRFNYRRAEEVSQMFEDRLWISVHSNATEEQSIAAAMNHYSSPVNGGIGPKKQGTEQNSKRLEQQGETGLVKRATLGHEKSREYWANEGYYVTLHRTARRGGYCGVRQLLVLKEGATDGGNWDNLLDKVPPVDV